MRSKCDAYELCIYAINKILGKWDFSHRSGSGYHYHPLVSYSPELISQIDWQECDRNIFLSSLSILKVFFIYHSFLN